MPGIDLYVPRGFKANNLKQENIQYSSAQSMTDQASNTAKRFDTFY